MSVHKCVVFFPRFFVYSKTSSLALKQTGCGPAGRVVLKSRYAETLISWLYIFFFFLKVLHKTYDNYKKIKDGFLSLLLFFHIESCLCKSEA
jgi:hypothetical protein